MARAASQRAAGCLETRCADDYDSDRVGPQIETFDELPAASPQAGNGGNIFDTRRFGKSAAGHDFPDVLTAEEENEPCWNI